MKKKRDGSRSEFGKKPFTWERMDPLRSLSSYKAVQQLNKRNLRAMQLHLYLLLFKSVTAKRGCTSIALSFPLIVLVCMLKTPTRKQWFTNSNRIQHFIGQGSYEKGISPCGIFQISNRTLSGMGIPMLKIQTSSKRLYPVLQFVGPACSCLCHVNTVGNELFNLAGQAIWCTGITTRQNMKAKTTHFAFKGT